jgi:hypothetical protein
VAENGECELGGVFEVVSFRQDLVLQPFFHPHVDFLEHDLPFSAFEK